MTKYKKGFTPLEGSLIAVGLNEFNEIPQIKQQPYIPKNEADTLTGILAAHAIHNNKVNEASEILSALEDEYKLYFIILIQLRHIVIRHR
ncbi:MAG: hypothetical protein ACJA0E_002228 [Bermanella sp.]|jgi:hypothetical protein